MQSTHDAPKWPYILLLIGNLGGLVFFLGGAAFMLFSALIDLVSPVPGLPENGLTTGVLSAFGLGMCALPFIPAGLFSLRRVQGKPILAAKIRPMKAWQGIVILVVWAGVTFLSDFLFQRFKLGWLASAPSYLLAIGLPVFFLIWLGVGGLPVGSRNRLWSTLGIGLSAGPLLATLLELFLYAGALLAGLVALSFNPNWTSVLQQLNGQLANATDINKIVDIVSPYLMNPAIIVILFLTMAVFTPMIEEAVKPFTVWLVGKRLRSPAEGFALGVLSGAGFALIEALLASSSPDQGWGVLLVARAGGSLMHTLGSGLMGWAIVSAYQGKRLRLPLIYLISISIHGLWNSAAVLIILGGVQGYLKTGSDSTANLLTVIGVVLLGLLVVTIVPAMILINRKLRPPAPEILPAG